MSQLKAPCPECNGHILVPPSLLGGQTNCPHCGKLVTLAGGTEPAFVAIKAIGVVGVLLVSGVVFIAAGPLAGVLTFVVMAGLAGLTYLML